MSIFKVEMYWHDGNSRSFTTRVPETVLNDDGEPEEVETQVKEIEAEGPQVNIQMLDDTVWSFYGVPYVVMRV